jgi:hypothetical protein
MSRLPPDVLGVVAQWLVAMDGYASCAALNVTSKDMRAETTRFLWRCVVYRFNNSSSGKRRSAVRWRTTFESQAARFVQYVCPIPGTIFRICFDGPCCRFLVVIPSHLPDTTNDKHTWEPPFLPLITAEENNLKACIVPSQGQILSVTLYDNYQPCSMDLLSVNHCARIVEDITLITFRGGQVRLCRRNEDTVSYLKQDKALQNAIIQQDSLIGSACRRMRNALPVLRLLLTTQNAPPISYVTLLAVDLMTWQRDLVWTYGDPDLDPGCEKVKPRTFGVGLLGANFLQGMAFARAVRHEFSRCGIELTCNSVDRYALPLELSNCTPAHHIASPPAALSLRGKPKSLRKSSSNSISAPAFFLKKRPGTVSMHDGSNESRKANDRPGMQPVSATISYMAGTRGRTECPAVIGVRVWCRGGTAPQVEEQLLLERWEGLPVEWQERDELLARSMIS